MTYYLIYALLQAVIIQLVDKEMKIAKIQHTHFPPTWFMTLFLIILAPFVSIGIIVKLTKNVNKLI